MSITKETLIEIFKEIYEDPELRIWIYKIISNLKCRNDESSDEYLKLEKEILGRNNYVTSIEDYIYNHEQNCSCYKSTEWI